MIRLDSFSVQAQEDLVKWQAGADLIMRVTQWARRHVEDEAAPPKAQDERKGGLACRCGETCGHPPLRCWAAGGGRSLRSDPGLGLGLCMNRLAHDHHSLLLADGAPPLCKLWVCLCPDALLDCSWDAVQVVMWDGFILQLHELRA